MKLLVLLVLIFVFVFVSATWAQGKGQVMGTAKDASGAVVPGAKIVIAKVSATAIADEYGAFKLEDLPPGEYVILVQSPGFVTWSTGGLLVEPDKVLKLEPELLVPKEEVIVAHSTLDPSYVDWYSRVLRSLEEPGLCENPSTNQPETYRFLWLRSFDEPFLVRVEIPEKGKARVTLKKSTGRGGYEPGKLKSSKTRALDEQEIEHLMMILKEADFWKLPTRVESNTIGVDGARWITEGTKAGTCHIVDRWSPEPGAYRGLGIEFLFHIAKLKLLYQDVY